MEKETERQTERERERERERDEERKSRFWRLKGERKVEY